MLAGGGRGERLLQVRLGGAREEDRVDVGSREQRVERGLDRDVHLGRQLRRTRAALHGDDIGAVHHLPQGAHVIRPIIPVPTTPNPMLIQPSDGDDAVHHPAE